MTSSRIYSGRALADGFAPHGNVLPAASISDGTSLTFYLADGARHRLTIVDATPCSGTGSSLPDA
jgi:hypothetical protein